MPYAPDSNLKDRSVGCFVSPGTVEWDALILQSAFGAATGFGGGWLELVSISSPRH
jgi:hypothetical protein